MMQPQANIPPKNTTRAAMVTAFQDMANQGIKTTYVRNAYRVAQLTQTREIIFQIR